MTIRATASPSVRRVAALAVGAAALASSGQALALNAGLDLQRGREDHDAWTERAAVRDGRLTVVINAASGDSSDAARLFSYDESPATGSVNVSLDGRPLAGRVGPSDPRTQAGLSSGLLGGPDGSGGLPSDHGPLGSNALVWVASLGSFAGGTEPRINTQHETSTAGVGSTVNPALTITGVSGSVHIDLVGDHDGDGAYETFAPPSHDAQVVIAVPELPLGGAGSALAILVGLGFIGLTSRRRRGPSA
jgi:hypothetical protein